MFNIKHESFRVRSFERNSIQTFAEASCVSTGLENKRMHVAVIGCGAAGIISAKYLTAPGTDFTCDVFEKTEQVGGTWVYSELEFDKYGLPVDTSMYKDLRTNLPKEVMEFAGFHYKGIEESYIGVDDVIKYLNDFVDYHDIRKHIKFEHLVKLISRNNGKWQINVTDLKNQRDDTYYYDAIFVCNGHYSIPSYPNIEGIEDFKGPKIHSHFYRTSKPFMGKKVLLIGIGPSGQDIAYCLSEQAELIYLSHHSQDQKKINFPENVIQKPDVSFINEHSVTFQDGSVNDIDAIMFCTGYKYHFPFLDKSCDIEVDNNYVKPLYKQVISIRHPTMFFIGLPVRTFIFPMVEIQVRLCMNILSGHIQLPSEKEMERVTLEFEEKQKDKGLPKKLYQMLGIHAKEYIQELIHIGQTEPLPEVIFKIYLKSCITRMNDLKNYRKEVFHIIDSENFTSNIT